MDTNGYSVQLAVYPEGYFIQTGPLTWRENGRAANFEFTESARDEWSVYLDDPSRKVSIQIDLHRKKIRYSDPETPWQDQHDVTRAASVVGWLVGYAEFRTNSTVGSYIETGPKAWRELNAKGETVFEFVESFRDDWSVTLNHPSRRVSIRIDLHRQKILYSDPKTPWRDQYDVSIARSVTGWTAGTVIFSAGSGKRAFVQILSKVWEERSPDSKTEFDLHETSRDDRSIYLKDPSSNVSIQIDLHLQKVLYTDPTTPGRDQYDILNAVRPYPGQIQPKATIDSTVPQRVQGAPQVLTRRSPGFIIKNDTIWPLQISLNQVGPLYYGIIEPGEYFIRDTGAVWFTIKAAIFLDEKDKITPLTAVLPVVSIVGSVILGAVTAGASAFAGGPALAAAGAAGVSGVTGLSSAAALATATAASTLVGAGFSAGAALVIGGAVVGGTGAALSATTRGVLIDIFKDENISASKAGVYAGPPWPFRTTVMPWRVTGGPTLRQVPGKNQVEPVGGALSIQR
ncbi:MAG TPA: hypothetical protein VF173_12550 [Thermoanaerobaculia bacterium]|nr:hypothetical protein [Thermoanaerobaculia bacterium]